MNRLGTDLKDKYVILDGKVFRGNDIQRVFLCKGGFGCNQETMGRAVMGDLIFDGSKFRVEGDEIERFANQSEVEEAKKLFDLRESAIDN